jgi:hypothetical protein
VGRVAELMPSQRGRQGDPSYAGPNSWRKRTTSGPELKPPDAFRCWAHDRPEKFHCPECIEKSEQDWETRVDA